MDIVTIGLPVYNAQLFIKDAIQSILNQTYSNFKLLIIDDGSTDDSIEIIKSFKDNRIELIVDNQNFGLPFRLNQMAQLSKTKYLARMDADDIMHPERIEVQLKILENNSKIDVLGTNVLSIDEYNKIQGIRYNNYSSQLLDCQSFVHPTIIAKTEWFINNPYDEKAIRVEDAELWERTKHTSIFKMCTLPLLFYREFGSMYYKKYFKGIPSMLYLVRKRKSFRQIGLTIKYVFVGLIYYAYHIFGKENVLIERRNHKFFDNDIYQSVLDEFLR